MICYFDTSALVKLYVEEDGSELTAAYSMKSSLWLHPWLLTQKPGLLFARAWRGGVLGNREYQKVVSNFKEEWPAFYALGVSDSVLQRVDTLIDRYRLRGFDAIHLASTIVLSNRCEGEGLVVGCWDAKLWDYYRQEGFLLLPEEPPVRRG